MKNLFRILLISFPIITNCQTIQENETCPIATMNNDPDIVCGSFKVVENRSSGNSRNITIKYAVLKAQNGNAKPDPLVFLQGGPGAGSIFMYNFFRNNIINQDRDVILVDQRGTGYSTSFCDNLGADLMNIIAADLSVEEEIDQMKKIAENCKEEVNRLFVDVNGYNSMENAADLEMLRKLLGYDQWNLMGGSYGSRLALTIMREFPEGVRSTILTGPFPPNADLYGTLIPNFKRSLDLVFKECEQSVFCDKSYPKLKERYYKLLEILGDKPLIIKYLDNEFIINSQDATLLVQQFLYQRRTIEQVPLFINALLNKDDVIIIRAIQTMQTRIAAINIGMYMSVQAYEEIPFGGLETFNKSLEANPELRHGVALFNSDVHVLPSWSDQIASAIESNAVKSDVPTLVLAGNLDPITPPSYGEITVRSLKNGYLKVLAGEGHVQFGSCFDALVMEFLDDPGKEPGSHCNESNNALNFR